jgi:gamma-glutamyltranspeptidase/glutathione hydrolase
MFQKGGNAVDAACAMLGATATMWDALAWGGETQALIYHPKLKKVIGINALGVAPSGATAGFYRGKGLRYPPEYGPLAAVTPGTPGGLMTMLAEYGMLSLGDVLAPAIEMADGYPIEAQLSGRSTGTRPGSRLEVFTAGVPAPPRRRQRRPPASCSCSGTSRHAAQAGGYRAAGAESGQVPKEAIYAAYARFYTGDIARELVRGVQEEGGLITLADLRAGRCASRSR